MPGLSIKLPVQRDPEDGYSLTKTYEQMIAQNFKHLILTFPGERVMDPMFGVGLKKFLFEPNDPSTYGNIEAKIRTQVERYLPFVKIINVETNFVDHTLNVAINYYISSLGVSDSLALQVDRK